MNLPALLIILLVSVILAIGVKHSSRFNNAIVMLKLAVIALFIVVAMGHVEPANWQPFMPFGWEGVMGGAALIFFAYIGFDAVSTAGERRATRSAICRAASSLRWSSVPSFISWWRRC